MPSADLLCVTAFDPNEIHVFGCYDSIRKWLQQATDVLSVLGFCVITFLKVCFTCILRYEIREMIQKIQVLKRSGSGSCPGHQTARTLAQDTSGKTDDKSLTQGL